MPCRAQEGAAQCRSMSGRAATRDDLEALKHELLTEIHRTARNMTSSLTTIMAVLNGIVFTALKLG